MPLDVRAEITRVFERLERWTRALPEPLRGAGETLAQALGAPPDTPLVEAWGDRLDLLVATPLILARRFPGRGIERLARDAAYGAVAGYFFIRIQDDVLDEPESIDTSYLLLGNELVAELFGTYRRLFPPRDAFWRYLDAYWRETSRFTLAERRGEHAEPGAPPEGDLARLGRKSGAAKIPMAAVCCAARRPAAIARYAAFLDTVHGAMQVLNDVVSLVKDLRHAHPSSVTDAGAATAATSGGATPEAVAGRMLLTTHLEDALDGARRGIDRARERLGPLGEGFDDVLDARRHAIELVRADLVRTKLTTLFALAGLSAAVPEFARRSA